MNQKRSILPLLAACFVAVACTLPFGAAQTGDKEVNPGGAPGGASGGAAVSTSAGKPADSQGASLTDRMKSFPIPPDSKMETNSADFAEPDEPMGSFIISSTSEIGTVVEFYETELPKLGWILRYADPNTECGVTQYWEYDAIFLTLRFGYEETLLTIRGDYRRVDPLSLNKYLPDLPLPETAVLVNSSGTSWEFYILQDYKAVELFYRQKLLALHWTTDGPEKPDTGSCGGDPNCDIGSGSSCPAGAVPMPSPTRDPRQMIRILYVMPNQNEVELTIIPHGSATILIVSITLKDLDSAGLPEDVPIYPDAVLIMVNPGTASFQITAGVDTVKEYYEDRMPAAGWAPEGNAYEDSGTYTRTWTKGDQRITITIISNENGTLLTLNCSSCR
jgi:hypothetical protein